MITDEIVTYEVAMLAKYRGFNVATEMYYHIHRYKDESQASLESTGCGRRFYNSTNTYRCAAPTQSLLQRWLREEKGYYVYPFFDNEELKWTYVVREKTGDMWIPLIGETPYYDCFDESMENALKFALKNLV